MKEELVADNENGGFPSGATSFNRTTLGGVTLGRMAFNRLEHRR
jgi:hypothetical protein